MTAHDAYANSDPDDTNYNSEMLDQQARNENESSLGTGNGGDNLDIDNDDSSFLIQDTIENNMTQSL
eukprot:6491213-Ditylum_brightwellii.AAC.1